MVWRKIAVKTKEEAVEILAAYLFDRWEIEGVEIEDGKGLTEEEAKIIFADILPEETAGNGEASLSFYLEILPEEEKKARKALVEKEFSDETVDHSYTLNSSNIFTEEECREILSDLKRELSEMAEYTEIGSGEIFLLSRAGRRKKRRRENLQFLWIPVQASVRDSMKRRSSAFFLWKNI